MAPIARGKKAPPTMLIIRSEDAMGGAFFRVESDRLKMVGNMMLIKNCSGMSSQNPRALPVKAMVNPIMAAAIAAKNSSFAGAIQRIRNVPVNRPIMNINRPSERPVAATELLTLP